MQYRAYLRSLSSIIEEVDDSVVYAGKYSSRVPFMHITHDFDKWLDTFEFVEEEIEGHAHNRRLFRSMLRYLMHDISSIQCIAEELRLNLLVEQPGPRGTEDDPVPNVTWAIVRLVESAFLKSEDRERKKKVFIEAARKLDPIIKRFAMTPEMDGPAGDTATGSLPSAAGEHGRVAPWQDPLAGDKVKDND